MCRAALTAFPAHPPGYPLYFLGGRAWLSFFSLGNPAYRLNLLSALSGAAAALLLFQVLWRAFGPWAALGGCAGFALGAEPWKFGLLSEMYSSQSLFLAALLALAYFPYSSRRGSWRGLFLSCLLLGLGLVNHFSLAFYAPAFAWPWMRRVRAEGVTLARMLVPAAGFFALGLLLQLAVWVRLDWNWPLFWDTSLRKSYGTFLLSAPLAAPLGSGLLGRLAGYWARELCQGGSGLWILCALLGMAARTNKPLWGVALLGLAGSLGLLAISRVDPASWTARYALEPQMLSSRFFGALLAAGGIDWLRRQGRPLPVLAALGIVLLGLSGFKSASHRDDFSAPDLARDLRLSIPPGSSAAIQGDAAWFSLRYLEALPGRASGIEMAFGGRPDLKSWIASRVGRRPVYLYGMAESRLRALGAWGNPYVPQPSGLAQRLVRSHPSAGALPRLRSLGALRGHWDSRPVSYDRNLRYDYAFDRYIRARIEERFLGGNPLFFYKEAAWIDPADFKLVTKSDINPKREERIEGNEKKRKETKRKEKD